MMMRTTTEKWTEYDHGIDDDVMTKTQTVSANESTAQMMNGELMLFEK